VAKQFYQIVDTAGTPVVLYQTMAETFRDAVQEALNNGVVLTSALLDGEDLSGLSARAASMASISGIGTIFDGSDFSSVTMTGADLTSASLVNVKFNEATMDTVTFDSATLDGAVFIDTVLTGASTTGVDNTYIKADAAAAVAFKIADDRR
jgi:uncharacterized protein YjbI with pentapeptide repeats